MAWIFDGYILTATLATIRNGYHQQTRKKEWELNPDEGANAAEHHTNAQDAATGMISAFTAISDASVVNYHLSEKWVNDAAVSADVDLFEEALVSLAVNDAGTKKASHSIPAPKLGIIEVGSRAIDPSDAQVVLYFNRFKASGDATLSDGENVRSATPILGSRLRSVKSGASY